MIKNIKTNKKNIVFFLYMFSQFFYAQEEKELEKIIVEGKTLSLPFSQTSQNVQIITRKQIENIPATSIEELLSYYSGIDIRQRGIHGAQADISIRGSSFEQVLVLVNGIRMNDSQTGHNTMSIPFDLASVERIEVVKGPAARRFGQNAYAGVINIITRPSGADDLTVSLSGGEFSSYSVKAGLNFSGEKLSQFLQVASSQSEGYRYNTDYLIKNAWYQNQYKLPKGKILFQAGIIEKKFGANSFYSSPKAKEQYEEIQTSLISLGFNQHLGKIKINMNAYWRRSQDEYIFVRSHPSVYRNLHIGNNSGIETGVSYTSGLGITGLGGDFRKEYLSSNNLGHRDRGVQFIFLDHHFSFFNKFLDVTPGISYAHYSDIGSFWYPGIDVGYKLDAKNKLFTNFGKTYRIPSYSDLYYSDPINDSNPDLKPENALSYELGYRVLSGSVNGTISLFRREAKDLIDWVKDKDEDKWKPVNRAKMNTNGVEIGFSQSFPKSFFLSYSIGYTYLENGLKSKKSNYSKYLLDNLRHQLVVKIENRLARNITNQIVYRYNDRVLLKDYHLLDDKLVYRLEDFTAFIQVNNILNTKYTEAGWVPMPGRWLQMGISMKNIF